MVEAEACATSGFSVRNGARNSFPHSLGHTHRIPVAREKTQDDLQVSGVAGGCQCLRIQSLPMCAPGHIAFLSGCAPLAFCPPGLTHKAAGQWLADARACPHCGPAHQPLGTTAAPRSPATLAWSRRAPVTVHGHEESGQESW